MNVHIPPSLQPMAPALSEFFDSMVFKLEVNSHKKALTDDDIDGLLEKLGEEIQEFREQRIADARDPNILSELADTGNFAFLLYAFLRSRGVMDLKERFIRDFYRVDSMAGRIFCNKTRSGSKLKIGDEVTGSVRNGVMYIRAQHTASGAAIYLPRRDIVWWNAYGSWPAYPLTYKEPEPPEEYAANIDALSNLVYGPVPNKPKYPYVSRYAPKGRENSEHFGKFIYQRRHQYKLVRAPGYWDTEEEAAREGLKAWKEKTRNA